MEWSNEAVLQFIEIYRNKELLWNPKNANHYNKLLKNDAWEEVSAEVGIPAEECRKKLISLLSSFRREKSKISKSQTTAKGTKDVYVPSWFAFKSLDFLLEKDIHRKRKSPIPDDELKQQGWFQEESLGIDSENGRPLPSESEKIDTEKNCPPPLVPPKNRRDNYTSIDDRLHKAFEILERAAIEGDECQAFGMFVAKKLKSYTPYTRSAVQHSFSNILFNADRGHYEQSNSKRHHSDSPIPNSPVHSPDSVPGPSTHLVYSTTTPSPPPN